MQISSAFVLFAFLTMALSGTYTLARPNDHTIGEKHLKSANTIDKRSISKFVDDKLIDTTFEIGLSKFEAIKTIKLAILRMLSTQIEALTVRVQKSNVLDLLNSPITKFITEEILGSLLLSDNKNNSPFNLQQQSLDAFLLREIMEVPVIHENTDVKLPLVEPSTFLEKEEESLPVPSNEEFSVQKF